MKQIAGAADGWTIDRTGDCFSASGHKLIPSKTSCVNIKLVNGNFRSVKVIDLIKRNFGEETMDLSKVSLDDLHNEIERRKQLTVSEIVAKLESIELEYSHELLGLAITRFLGE